MGRSFLCRKCEDTGKVFWIWVCPQCKGDPKAYNAQRWILPNILPTRPWSKPLKGYPPRGVPKPKPLPKINK